MCVCVCVYECVCVCVYVCDVECMVYMKFHIYYMCTSQLASIPGSPCFAAKCKIIKRPLNSQVRVQRSHVVEMESLGTRFYLTYNRRILVSILR